MEQQFQASLKTYETLRGGFVERQHLPYEFELLVRFDEKTCSIWALGQQALYGDINAPSLLKFLVSRKKELQFLLCFVLETNFMDPEEKSWMWSWIKGNQKWHAWNKCRGKRVSRMS